MNINQEMIETFEISKKKHAWWLVGFVGLLAIVGITIWQHTLPPQNFPTDSAITISRGLSASSIAHRLEEQNVVKSNLLLYIVLVWFHDPANIQAGTFVYQEPLNVWQVAKRLTSASGAENLVAVTLPEGFTVKEFAKLASIGLRDFDTERFVYLGEDREGYLFPDTYYLPDDFTAEELVNLLKETYNRKTATLADEMRQHPLGEYGVITLASLLEREANNEESMRTVSGILQTRLEINMPLQADASMEYVLNRPLNELEASDLEIDSPYNTYLYRGLPPTPIGNPGIMSIRAVLTPIETDFLYYLTDSEGQFHYAETFDEHRSNIARYLK